MTGEHGRPSCRSGESLGGTTEAYNKAVGSLETRVLITARKFKELGTTGLDDQIEELPPVEVTPRLLQAPELAVGEREWESVIQFLE